MLERSAGELRSWVQSVLELVQGSLLPAALPHDLQATSFQWAVWRAPQAIPAGSTRSYGEIAEALGRPSAARAVARACAALVVPCHRAVRGDGDPGGYRRGAGRKRKLLDGERRSAKE